MSTWCAAQYLKFAEERTRPSRDLASRIDVSRPMSIIDLGCGPGNSTEVLAQRWPDAQVTGLDNSTKMIEAARSAHPEYRWVEADIAGWSANGAGERFDIVFSNAALQWLPDHAFLLPALLQRVGPGGAFAFQMPAHGSPAHRLMQTLARSRSLQVADWHCHEPAFYYDVLSLSAARVDLWETEYVHVMDDAEGIVEWYRGTGLRPYLGALPTESERERFLAEFLDGVRKTYPKQIDGKVLFPFRRLFAIAYTA